MWRRKTKHFGPNKMAHNIVKRSIAKLLIKPMPSTEAYILPVCCDTGDDSDVNGWRRRHWWYGVKGGTWPCCWLDMWTVTYTTRRTVLSIGCVSSFPVMIDWNCENSSFGVLCMRWKSNRRERAIERQLKWNDWHWDCRFVVFGHSAIRQIAFKFQSYCCVGCVKCYFRGPCVARVNVYMCVCSYHSDCSLSV